LSLEKLRNLSAIDMMPYFLPACIGLAVALLYAVYRLALPKPIPGDIPYNRDATKSILGDIPTLMKFGDPFEWLREQTIKHNSPIVQVFARPFSKPWVILADYREAYDISARRTREFDRSDHIRIQLGGALPDHHVWRKTDSRWKYNRSLIQDLMVPAFLQTVAAPRLHYAVSGLVSVWKEKSRLAKGHPFLAEKDIYLAALDGVWSFAFGFDENESASRAFYEDLAHLQAVELPRNIDEPVDIPESKVNDIHNAVLSITDRVGSNQGAPFPIFNDWWRRTFLPEQTKAYRVKEKFIKDSLDKASIRFNNPSDHDTQDVRCALDYMLKRETQQAQRAGKRPQFHSREIYDEVSLAMILFRFKMLIDSLAVRLSHCRSRYELNSIFMVCQVSF
jgi:hypothetical protein